MGILRSEPMLHGTLVIPVDRGIDIIDTLGQGANLQIEDMNIVSMRRPYKRAVQRIEEMERMLRYLIDEISKLPDAKIEDKHYESFLEHASEYELDSVEESLQTLYQQFIKFRENNDDLVAQRNQAIMEKAVAQAAASSLQSSRTQSSVRNLESLASQALLQADSERGAPVADIEITGFSNFAGVLSAQDQEKLARTLFRVTRGNAFTHFEELKDDALEQPSTPGAAPVQKVVFVVYYQGGPGSALHEKISRICQAFGVDVFHWPESRELAAQRVITLNDLIADKSKALEGYEAFFLEEISVLLEVLRPGGNSLIAEWQMVCTKWKAMFACLNLFEASDATLRAECWYPAEDEEKIRGLLNSVSGPSQVPAFLVADRIATKKSPPTYIKTTGFTEGFQNLVNTYGVPRYLEANPGLLTIVTFPYLFGIMFGDIGHGFIVLLAGIGLVLGYEKMKNGDEMMAMVAYGRYMILMMGMFAVYSGFMYNDFFSLGCDIFGTRWVPGDFNTVTNETTYQQTTSEAFPYPFGFDPMWKGAENELTATNSFKMKYSVIVAFVQMTAGVVLKGFNAVYFKNNLVLFFEFIPQLLFLMGLVGYMDFLIIFKWWKPLDIPIISTIINMYMMTPLTDDMTFYSGQGTVQMALLAIIIICVPWMLIPKPVLEIMENKKKKKKIAAHDSASIISDEDRVALAEAGGVEGDIGLNEIADGEEEHTDSGEIFIHQLIETIEFVLGSISNTASYLRLWALSLAHQQLALVFFEKIMLAVLNNTVTADGNVVVPAIMVFFGFAVFAGITFAVLLCMDSLECFLHALRLQWVEFQNKFYAADGHRFIPYNFLRILSGADDD